MMTKKTTLLACAFLTVLCAAPVLAARLGYDPKADPFEQYHDAIALANAQNKLVLIVAGGDWCSWCYVFDRFVERDADVKRGLEDGFVVVKVYIGDENYNEQFFEQLPRAYGAPHLWIVSPERVVLASQPTGVFERNKRTYDKQEFLSFLERWNAHGAHRHAERLSQTP